MMAALPARQHPSTARPVRPEPARPRHRGDISNDTRRHGPRLGQAAPSERGFHQHHHIVPRRPTRPRGRLGSPSPASPTSASSSPRGAAQRRPGITRRDAGGSGARSTTTPAHTSKQHAHFRQHGYTDGAKAILIAQRRRARSAIRGPRALPRRLLDTAHSLTVAYGYRPGRACGYSRSCSSWLPPRSRYAALSPRCAPLSPAPYTPPKDPSDPAPRIRPPQQEIRVPPRGDQLEPPAGTGRSAASTPFSTPSAPSFRSYHPAKEPPGTPALTLPTEPSCHGGPTPPPYPAGCHLRFLFCPWQDLPARCDGPDT